MSTFNNYEDIDSLQLMFDEIERSLEAKVYLAALHLALSIPDMLGKLAYPPSTKNKYVKWFDDNVKDLIFGHLHSKNPLYEADDPSPRMSGEVCYAIRNKLFHEGTNDIEARTNARISEFVLSMGDEEWLFGNYSGVDYGFHKVNLKTGEVPKTSYLYVSCKCLCLEIIMAAKEFVNNNPNLKYQTIRINKGGGHFNSDLF